MTYVGTSYVANGFYGVVMKETQGAETKILRTSDVGGISMPFYLSSKTNCGLTPTIDFDSKEMPTLFPNPTADILFINSENEIEKIELINTMGQLMLSINNPPKSINISDLPKGLFIAKLSIGKVVFNQKIIKL
jgi:Secretion system C-terminal sorting domain